MSNPNGQNPGPPPGFGPGPNMAPRAPAPGYGPPPGYPMPPPGPFAQPSSPMAFQTAPAPARRSRSLPIAVASGLAIGVFAGLFFFRGTETAEARGSGSEAEVAQKTAGEESGAGGDKSKAGEGDESATAGGDESTAGDKGSSEKAAGGDEGEKAAATGNATEEGDEAQAAAGEADAGAVAAAGEADAAPDAILSTAYLTFDIEPQEALDAEDFSLSIDEVPVVPGGDPFPVALRDGKRRVKVVAKARGFHSIRRHYTIRGDKELKLRFHKRGRKPHHGNPGGPGGLIDL